MLHSIHQFGEEKTKHQDQSFKIKALRTDRGSEYLFEQFKFFYDENGIARQLNIPYTPQQNGIAKIRNKTLFNIVRSMMVHANLPISF